MPRRRAFDYSTELFIISLMVCGCSTVLKGTEQSIEFVTNPPGAECTVMRDGKLIREIKSTPASIKIDKQTQQLVVQCTMDDLMGVKAIASRDNEDPNYASYVPILGLLLGPASYAVDRASGAYVSYPSVVQIDLYPKAR
jgi:hypothetical protein